MICLCRGRTHLSVLFAGRAAPSLPSDEGFKDVSCETEDWCFGRPLDGKTQQGLRYQLCLFSLRGTPQAPGAKPAERSS